MQNMLESAKTERRINPVLTRRAQSMKIDHWKAIDIINIINNN